MRERDYWEFDSEARPRDSVVPPVGFLRRILRKIANGIAWIAVLVIGLAAVLIFILPAMKPVWFCATGCDFETHSRLRARWHEIGTYLWSRAQYGHIMVLEDVPETP